MPPTTPSYERNAIGGVSIDDLHQDRLREFVKQRAPFLDGELPPERLAASLGLLGGIGGRLAPTVAGLLLFGKYPQLVHPEWGVAALRVRGATLSDEVLARGDLEGNLRELLDRALAFVREHSSEVASLAPGEASEPEYPEVVIREAVLNALVHRDYRLTGRVAVRIYDDRLEVWSPGGMPVQLSLEHLAQRGGVSFPRNPLIASAARTLGLMDQVGRGLPLIRSQMAELTTQPARFASSQADFLVVIPSRLHVQTPEAAGN